MLKQRDFKLVHALNGIHRRRHLFLTLYLLATAIILMWLLGLGTYFSNTGRFGRPGPYWMSLPIAFMVGMYRDTIYYIYDMGHHYGFISGFIAEYYLFDVLLNGMFLLPIALPFAFSLFWFLREFAQAASEPMMDPPSLSRDASLAIPLGALLCVTAPVTLFYFIALLKVLLKIIIGTGSEHFLPPLPYGYNPSLHGPNKYISPLFLWPIFILIAFVALRVLAPWRRGVRRPLHELLWIAPLSIVVMVLAYLSIRTLPLYGRHWVLFSQCLSHLFLCLLSLHWSLGALIALAYRWPRLRDAMTRSCCVQCGYDMRGSFAVGHRECPECGQVNEITPAVGTQA